MGLQLVYRTHVKCIDSSGETCAPLPSWQCQIHHWAFLSEFVLSLHGGQSIINSCDGVLSFSFVLCLSARAHCRVYVCVLGGRVGDGKCMLRVTEDIHNFSDSKGRKICRQTLLSPTNDNISIYWWKWAQSSYSLLLPWHLQIYLRM